MSVLRRLILLTTLISPFSLAQLEYTLAYIESLLEEGKPVAVFLVDMQVNYVPLFGDNQSADIVQDQARLIEALAGRENVHFINVNYEGEGMTLPRLQFRLRKAANLTIFIKTTNDTFKGKGGIAKDFFISRNSEVAAEKIPTEMKEYLQNKGIKDILITGCFDGACVMETAKSAMEADFRTVVDRDLNIIFDKRALREKGVTEDIVMETFQKDWDDLRKTYPDLLVFDPVRYSSCKADT